MKTRTLLIAAAMLIALSAAAFGQAIYAVSSTPVTTVTATGNAELTGAITFTNSNAAAALAGTITLQYSGGVNITSSFKSTDANPITIVSTGSVVTVDQTASVYSPGLLVLDVPVGYAGNITVTGVRIQIAGTALTNVTATVSATGNQITAGETVVTVVNGIAAGLASQTSYNLPAAVPTALASKYVGTPTIASATGVLSAGVTGGTTNITTIAIKEGYLSAFQHGVGVQITLSAVPQSGISFQFPATATSYDATTLVAVTNGGWATGTTAGVTPSGAITISSASTASGALSVYYYVVTDGPTENTNLETLEIPVTIVTSAPTSSPYTPMTYTYQVSLAPIQGAYSSGSPAGLAVPRFTQSYIGTSNLATVLANSTALLMNYVTSGGGLNTGIAIANTSLDPGATALNLPVAGIPQGAAITFYFFPQTAATKTAPPASFSYVTGTCTGGDPGSGLNSGTGVLAAGSTYTVLLSQLLGCTTWGATTPFAGYVIAVANFTNAHGIFTVQNSAFTIAYYSALMQVLYNRQNLPEIVQF